MATDIDDLLDLALTGATEPEATRDNFAPEREGYQWAVDVFWVYEHLGDRISKEKAVSSGRYAQWKWAQENIDSFVGQLLPKAMGILEKARAKQGDNELIEAEEKKDIAAMTRMLARAVAEATQEGNSS